MELKGKKALVTGASRGIGRAIAIAFANAGIQTVGTSRFPEKVEWPEGVRGVALDLTDEKSVERDWLGSGLEREAFDIVVNNAGAGVFGAFQDTDFSSWAAQIRLLLSNAMKVSHLALGTWSVERSGVLVNVSSLAAEFPIPYMSGYNAAKAGLATFSESLSLEIDPAIARIVDLRLGDVDTGFNDAMKAPEGDETQKRVWAALERHLHQGIKPEAVASALLKALEKERSGTVRVGTWFQATLASLFGKLVSQNWRRRSTVAYYDLSKD